MKIKTGSNFLTTLLLLLFVYLKLTGHIDWSWFWVLSPVWIPIFLTITFVGFFYLLKFLAK